MALLEKAIDAQVEECVRFQVYIPPLVWNGRKYRLTDETGAIQGTLPPISFLVPDGAGGLLRARFHPMEMRWEVFEGEQADG